MCDDTIHESHGKNHMEGRLGNAVVMRSEAFPRCCGAFLVGDAEVRANLALLSCRCPATYLRDLGRLTLMARPNALRLHRLM